MSTSGMHRRPFEGRHLVPYSFLLIANTNLDTLRGLYGSEQAALFSVKQKGPRIDIYCAIVASLAATT